MNIREIFNGFKSLKFENGIFQIVKGNHSHMVSP